MYGVIFFQRQDDISIASIAYTAYTWHRLQFQNRVNIVNVEDPWYK